MFFYICRSVWKSVTLLHKNFLSKTILMKLSGNTSDIYLYHVSYGFHKAILVFLIFNYKLVSTAASGIQTGMKWFAFCGQKSVIAVKFINSCMKFMVKMQCYANLCQSNTTYLRINAYILTTLSTREDNQLQQNLKLLLMLMTAFLQIGA